MTVLLVKFDGHVLIPEQPLDFPKGSFLEVSVTAVEPRATPHSALMKLAELAGRFPENPASPGDAAAQHDHYLYGTPKRL